MSEIDSLDLENMEQMKQFEQMKKQLLTKVLTKDAYERLSRVRIVNANLAGQAELYILQIYQQGKLHEKVTDEQMKDVLKTLTEKKNINIRRK